MLPARTSLRGFVVVALVLAWLVAINHCAFASASVNAGPARSEQGGMPSGCPMHRTQQQQPEPQKQNTCGDLPCCKNLQTPAAASAQLVNPPSLAILGTFFTPAFDGNDSETARVAYFSDTGPPGECSFAELVLQRSILAHAPPVSLS